MLGGIGSSEPSANNASSERASREGSLAVAVLFFLLLDVLRNIELGCSYGSDSRSRSSRLRLREMCEILERRRRLVGVGESWHCSGSSGSGEDLGINLVVLGGSGLVVSLGEVRSLAEERDGSDGSLVLKTSVSSVDRVFGRVSRNGINGGVREARGEVSGARLSPSGRGSAVEPFVEAGLRRDGVLQGKDE